MKKIGILTINNYNNYGNRLQNYALQEILKSMEFDVKTIVNIIKNKSSNSVKYKLRKVKYMSTNLIYKELNTRLNNYLYKKNKTERIKAFKKFTREYIEETDYFISDNNIPDDLSQEFDYFITGSDQVWNPNFRHGSTIDFLTFAPRHKRIAYAPSFGISKIPEEYIDRYKTWLSEMYKLSVREEAGAKIIKELTGRDAVVLVDPTLMLTKEKWLSISKRAKNKPEGKYLLTYFLRSVSKETKQKIKSIATKNKLQIVNLADIRDKKTYTADPSEFIDYINSASVFLTDSFHGAVFSILLEVPFIVFNREGSIHSMNSRIDTLLSKFKLESRRANNITDNSQIFEIDYSHVPPILEAERKKAYEYLKEALNVKDGVQI